MTAGTSVGGQRSSLRSSILRKESEIHENLYAGIQRSIRIAGNHRGKHTRTGGKMWEKYASFAAGDFWQKEGQNTTIYLCGGGGR